MNFYYILIVLAVIFILLVITNFRIVPQAKTFVVERLGAYSATWSVGVHVLVPIIDKIARKVDMKEQVWDFPPQPVITKDNVTMMIDTVVFLQVTDPKLFAYGVMDPLKAIENLAATSLRNIIGDLELDETLTSRDMINGRMRAILDDATDSWGIKVNRVEVKNITPPHGIQEAMEKQMRAERERRESILRAEGEKQAAILVAEGQKAAVILKAEADKAATILNAEASKEAAIRNAEGEAQAILSVQSATADGLKMLKSVSADDALIKLKGIEAFQKAADGKATKIIIPSDIQKLAGLVTSVTEISR